MSNRAACPGCGRVTDRAQIDEAHDHAFWQAPNGACPACVQKALLSSLLDRGERHFASAVQEAWPLDAEAAFGALPTPLRLRADPRFTGRGVTIAIADSAFAPHPDLVAPENRIRAWVDATNAALETHRFGPSDRPGWPGSAAAENRQWHGTMTSVALAGNGFAGHGLYRGLASDARLVLVQVADQAGRITDQSIVRALRWIAAHAEEFEIRVVSLSVAGDAAGGVRSPIDAAVEQLVTRGITVVAAAGNAGERRLVPPATAPSAITVGGIDDMNLIAPEQWRLWHSNYGESDLGLAKPEVVAPSLWVVAPVLPGSEVASEARALFDARRAGDSRAAGRIEELKLVTAHYQHVEGTSFAAPLAAGTVGCALEANHRLTPRLVKELLIRWAHPVPGAPPERQGAGAIDAGRVVAGALLERHRWQGPAPVSPFRTHAGVVFELHDHLATQVQVYGSWDDWEEGLPTRRRGDGVWVSPPAPLGPGEYFYKFQLGGDTWLPDPLNPTRVSDGVGGINSRLVVS